MSATVDDDDKAKSKLANFNASQVAQELPFGSSPDAREEAERGVAWLEHSLTAASTVMWHDQRSNSFAFSSSPARPLYASSHNLFPHHFSFLSCPSSLPCLTSRSSHSSHSSLSSLTLLSSTLGSLKARRAAQGAALPAHLNCSFPFTHSLRHTVIDSWTSE